MIEYDEHWNSFVDVELTESLQQFRESSVKDYFSDAELVRMTLSEEINAAAVITFLFSISRMSRRYGTGETIRKYEALVVGPSLIAPDETTIAVIELPDLDRSVSAEYFGSVSRRRFELIAAVDFFNDASVENCVRCVLENPELVKLLNHRVNVFYVFQLKTQANELH